jgi:hypothetical protein
MAYDRYDTRRDWRGDRSRWQGDDRPERGWNNDRDRGERGWFERAGDEIASWFGDDEAERRQRQDDRGGGRERFAGHLRNEDDVRSYYGHRDHDREFFGRDRDTSFRRDRGDSGRNRDDRAFMSDEEFSRYERRPGFRDEGYRRPYTGRFTGRGGRDRDDRGFRPMSGDSGRGTEERIEQGASFYGVGAHHDRHYGEWRSKQIDQLDRDYEDYARENRSRFEDDFSSWRDQRQQKRGLLGQIREHMEVLGSDGEHVGTVDRTAGDRLILAKSDPESGGAHHSLMCTLIDRVEGNQVFLDTTASEAKQRWRDDSRERALFERDDQGEAGPGTLNRSFSGTY